MEVFDGRVRYDVGLWGRADQHLGDSGRVSSATVAPLRALAHHDGRARVREVSADIGMMVGAASTVVDRSLPPTPNGGFRDE